MRRKIAMLAVGGLVFALSPAGALANPSVDNGMQQGAKPVSTARPAGVNPFLALTPTAPSRADYAAWRNYLVAQGKLRATQKAALKQAVLPPLNVTETEPPGTSGQNEVPATAQKINQFGTAKGYGLNPKATVHGSLAAPQVVPAESIPATAEDDGSIPLAGPTGIGSVRQGALVTATIGDGPHGSAGSDSGDFDFYSLQATAGQGLEATMSTPVGFLDTMLGLFDASGNLLAFNDDFFGLDSHISFRFTASGTYYLFVTGFNVVPADPFDSGSGDGSASEGPYNMDARVGNVDVDMYAVNLRKGDVLGLSVDGVADHLVIFDPALAEVHGSNQDASFIYPANTPLPGGGNAVNDHVADSNGWHYILVEGGVGDYTLTIEAYRPGLEGQTVQQTIFLDFNGQRVNTNIWGGPGVRTLSPLSAFLANWGLSPSDETALINAIVAEVNENVKQDMIASGLNAKFRVKITDSKHNPDNFGNKNVSRVIVGGTIAESGINTIGISQFIDPGNFDTQESALVLLDVLSDVGGSASLNTYITPASNRIAFIAQAVGNVISHEIGHSLGNFHVDQFNDILNLMDQGGNFPLLYGVGDDGIGGTADDPDVDFGEDVFNPGEGFTGIEDTRSRIAFVLTR